MHGEARQLEQCTSAPSTVELLLCIFAVACCSRGLLDGLQQQQQQHFNNVKTAKEQQQYDSVDTAECSCMIAASHEQQQLHCPVNDCVASSAMHAIPQAL
jgi:hypothetical protein